VAGQRRFRNDERPYFQQMIVQKKRIKQVDRMLMAFQRATLDLSKNSFAPDPFRYCDYDYRLNETLEELCAQLKEHEYRPQKAENFDLPKGKYAIRPGVIVDVLDLTIINRLLEDFIFKLDAELPAGVTAYRLRTDKKLGFKVDREHVYYVMSRAKRERIKIEQSWYDLWAVFKEELIKDLKDDKFKFVARTDISTYFEDINHYILSDILKQKVKGQSGNINLITEIYRSWAVRDPSRVRQPRGLPQGSNTSGILSNFYLEIVDSYLEEERKKGKIKWYRYCDDIYVLCKSELRATAILLKIGRLLRMLGLKQNSQKTEPITAQKALSEIHNSIADNLKEIMDESRKKKIDVKELKQRFKSNFRNISRLKLVSKKHETALFTAYTAASVLNIDILKQRVGKDFLHFPTRAKNICKYARQFINSKPVYRRMAIFLTQRERLLLYNFQLAHLVSVFRNVKKIDLHVAREIWSIVNEKERHWYVKEQSICTLSFLGRGFLTKNRIIALLNVKNHAFIRRASLSLVPICCNREDSIKMLQHIARELDVRVARMSNFILTLIDVEEPAIRYIQKFEPMNSIYVGDQFWILRYLCLNQSQNVKKRLSQLLRRLRKEFRTNQIVCEEIEIMDTILGPFPNIKRKPPKRRVRKYITKQNIQNAEPSKELEFAKK